MSTEQENPSSQGPSEGQGAGAFPQIQMEEFMLLKQQHDELATKVSDYENLIKRQQAEFENYRRRTLREREETLRYSGGDVLRDLLSVVDNFDRAAAVPLDESGNVPKAFFDGMMLIRNQFLELLSKNAVREIDGVGTRFNPEIHMAIAQDTTTEQRVDTVAEVFQKGYWHHEKVLRVSTVKVLKSIAPSESPAAEVAPPPPEAAPPADQT